MSRPKSLERRVQISLQVSETQLAQINLFAFDPAGSNSSKSGVSDLLATAWKFYLNHLRKTTDTSIYPRLPEVANAHEKLIDLRKRVLDGENIPKEEYSKALALIREERGMIKSTSKSNGVSKQVQLPADLNDLFAGLKK